MFKLLTEEAKQKVSHEYMMRRSIVMLAALVLILVVGIIGILPSYVLSQARQNEVAEQVKFIGGLGLEEHEAGLKKWLGDTNRKLTVLSPKLDTDRPSDFIEKILWQNASGVRITGFSWTKEEGKVALSISGVASNRQALVAFENLINTLGFANANIPISDLAKDKDIDFQIRFSPL